VAQPLQGKSRVPKRLHMVVSMRQERALPANDATFGASPTPWPSRCSWAAACARRAGRGPAELRASIWSSFGTVAIEDAQLSAPPGGPPPRPDSWLESDARDGRWPPRGWLEESTSEATALAPASKAVGGPRNHSTDIATRWHPGWPQPWRRCAQMSRRPGSSPVDRPSGWGGGAHRPVSLLRLNMGSAADRRPRDLRRSVDLAEATAGVARRWQTPLSLSHGLEGSKWLKGQAH